MLSTVTTLQTDTTKAGMHLAGVSMSTAKEEVRKMLDQIFDDASFEDIQYHIYVREKIERGLKDIKEGRVLSQEEVERRMSKWLGR
ncbi:hypothetical protein HKBW3S06_00008 [Candidatus Hakubella thermalkaliphila]|uniref:Uncharacterized protein n=1 Tax=Candidatus Hakubella thermalkaliphila TaxID=2754717 RepID=A0A6V8NNE3_9ACTN|nr:hypothetical protein HKBW3S06_00008 [Candidatus Hakubella thermalkaliphila]